MLVQPALLGQDLAGLGDVVGEGRGQGVAKGLAAAQVGATPAAAPRPRSSVTAGTPTMVTDVEEALHHGESR